MGLLVRALGAPTLSRPFACSTLSEHFHCEQVMDAASTLPCSFGGRVSRRPQALAEAGAVLPATGLHVAGAVFVLGRAFHAYR